ncbi:long-chain fatty acid--CoA ligase [Amycolatopsis sp. WAC 04182]|uniref:class I adenylate-forming enzyme family protein n=1 Tax=Amycolatopsis sp. WAC 04182 TaxID=2203198 RepID=UPI000F788428|nr:AMP-binding protein [Amycolatopsis sp. WAC 04182]RSN62629.1 long-chain fatty acid--CoA ligase [Amycolatopsis sp. WAC 04182]
MKRRSWWGEDLLGRGSDDELWAYGERAVTRGRLRAEVAWLAGVYRHHGIGAGTTVALHGTPGFTQLWSVFALWELGAQVALIEQKTCLDEMTCLLGRWRPRYFVTFGGSGRRSRPFTDECEVLVRRLPDGEPASTGHCLLQLSSGTTGTGKLIGRTPESILAELGRISAVDGVPGPGERVLLLNSLAHSFGMVGGVLHGLDTGAPLLFPARSSVVRTADVVLGEPRDFARLSEETVAPFTSLRAAISSGDVLHHEVFDRFRDRHGVRIGQAYGTTETGVIAMDVAGRFAVSGVGKPVPGIRTRVADGVLDVHLARSPYVIEAEPWFGGWLSTGDRVRRDPVTGSLQLLGRTERAGGGHRDLDLLEIERVLAAHREVTDVVVLGSDVIEAHVAGTTALDPDHLGSWCRRLLGAEKTPSRYHVLPALPRTTNGKYLRDRNALRTAGWSR